MSLLFSGAAGHVVNHGGVPAMDNATTLTVALWVYPTAVAAGNSTLCARGLGAAGNRVIFRYDVSGNGRLRFVRLRATTNTVYMTNDNFLTVNEWQYIVAVFNTGAGAGEIVNIYRGSSIASLVEATYATATDGSGAVSDDSADSLIFGNLGALDQQFPGRIATVQVWTRALSLAEIRTQQFRSHKTANQVLSSIYGYNGVGAQPDYSGGGNPGTVTGATVAPHAPLGSPFGGDEWAPYVVSAAPATTATVALGGSGRLAIAAAKATATTVSERAGGLLATVSTRAATATAALAASGRLATASVKASSGIAGERGQARLSTAGTSARATLAALRAAGLLSTATQAPAYSDAAALRGMAWMQATSVRGSTGTVALSGRGRLAVAASRAATALAVIRGSGRLAGVASSARLSVAVLRGQGVLQITAGTLTLAAIRAAASDSVYATATASDAVYSTAAASDSEGG